MCTLTHSFMLSLSFALIMICGFRFLRLCSSLKFIPRLHPSLKLKPSLIPRLHPSLELKPRLYPASLPDSTPARLHPSLTPRLQSMGGWGMKEKVGWSLRTKPSAVLFSTLSFSISTQCTIAN